MSIQKIIDTVDEIKAEKNFESLLSAEWVERLAAVSKELEENADLAKEIVLQSIPEDKMVKFMFMIQKSLVSSTTLEGDVSLLKADLSGVLTSYTHSVILSTIGALIQEEIL